MQRIQTVWTLTLFGLIPLAASAVEPARPAPPPNTAVTVRQDATAPGTVISGRIIGVDQATGTMTLRGAETNQTVTVGTAPILFNGKLLPLTQIRLGDIARVEQATTPAGTQPLTQRVTITRPAPGAAPTAIAPPRSGGDTNNQPAPVTGVVPAPRIRLPIAAPATIPSAPGTPVVAPGAPVIDATGVTTNGVGAVVAPGVGVTAPGVITTDGITGTVVAPGVVVPGGGVTTPGVVPGAIPGTPAIGPSTGLVPGLTPQGVPLRAAPAGPIAGTTVAPPTGTGLPGSPGVVPGTPGLPTAPAGVQPGAPTVVPLVQPPAPRILRPGTAPSAGVRPATAPGGIRPRTAPVPRTAPRRTR